MLDFAHHIAAAEIFNVIEQQATGRRWETRTRLISVIDRSRDERNHGGNKLRIGNERSDLRDALGLIVLIKIGRVAALLANPGVEFITETPARPHREGESELRRQVSSYSTEITETTWK